MNNRRIAVIACGLILMIVCLTYVPWTHVFSYQGLLGGAWTHVSDHATDVPYGEKESAWLWSPPPKVMESTTHRWDRVEVVYGIVILRAIAVAAVTGLGLLVVSVRLPGRKL
jgi:hypothetical protein